MHVPFHHFEEDVSPITIVHGDHLSSVPEWVEEAHVAQRIWGKTSMALRRDWLKKVRGLLVERAPAMVRKEAHEIGAADAEILSSQIIPLCDACRFLEREARDILKPRKLGLKKRPAWLLGTHAEIAREPLGVVLIIAPSNYRLFLPGVQILQALIAGNAILLKPGPGGTRIAREFMTILQEAGLDERLCRVLPELPASVSEAISSNVNKVVFTGSAETGRKILLQSAYKIIPATVELSGSDAVIVRTDADIPLVARALIFGLRLNKSETCIAPRRVIVPAGHLAEIEKHLCELLPNSIPSYTGSNPTLFALIERALDIGATLAAGKLLSNGQIQFPVILSNASPTMQLLKSDVFAAVLSIVPVATDEEAVAVANASPYGLGASIFSADLDAANRIAARLNVGSVVINDLIVPTADSRLPFGGRKESGFGVTRGAEGLLEMTAPKVVVTRKTNVRHHLEQASPTDAVLLENYLKAFHGKNIATRMKGWVEMAQIVLKRKSSKGSKI